MGSVELIVSGFLSDKQNLSFFYCATAYYIEDPFLELKIIILK